MLNDIKYGDLFLRRVMRLIFLLSLFLSCEQGFAQSNLLDKQVDIGKNFDGSSEELINKVGNAAGVTISYSNKVYVHKRLKLPFRRGNLRQFLDAIFSRFPVEYIMRDNKIIVSAVATHSVRLGGYCRDALSGEMLIGANVYDTLLYAGCATNGYGFFSVSLPQGRAAIRASFVGYESEFREIDLRSDTIVEIRLTPALRIQDVNVVGEVPDADKSKMGMVDIPVEQVKGMPTLLGESDIIRAFQKTPGVQSGEEGYGGLSVRGGDVDQNIFLLDDVPLYSSTHLMGMFSVFNAEAVNSTQLYKGAFPARYGGRLSSVLDVKLREGDMEHFNGYANIGLLSSTIMLEGPIKKDKVSFITSARRTYFDVFSSQVQRGNDNRYSFFFYDISAKLNYRISPSNRLYISFFVGKDALINEYNFQNQSIRYGNNVERTVSNNDEQSVNWNNLVASARWNHLFGNALFANFAVSYSHYRFNYNLNNYMYLSNAVYESNQRYFNGITDIEAKADFNWYTPYVPGSVRFGVSGVRHYFYPGLTMSSSVVDNETINDGEEEEYEDKNSSTARNTYYCSEVHGYFEDEVRTGRLSFNAGVHFSTLLRDENSPYLCIEPRLTLGYDILQHWRMQFGFSHNTQFVQQLRLTTVASPADMWLPISSNCAPPRSHLYSVQSTIHWDSYSFVTELYYKDYVRKQTYKMMPTTAIMQEGDWDDIFCQGEGSARGLELFLHRKTGRLNGWAGYSLSHSYCTYPDVNGGRRYDADNDCRHSASLYACYKLNAKVDLSAAWSYHSGAPITIADSRYTILGDVGSQNSYAVEGERNAYRMRSSHSLNIGAVIHRQTENANHTFSFGIYNVYARQNPMFVYWKSSDDGSYRLRQFSLIAFPWPYIKYAIKF